jgi:hypothetical protein
MSRTATPGIDVIYCIEAAGLTGAPTIGTANVGISEQPRDDVVVFNI